MNIKRIILAGILVIVLGICGCGNKEKSDSKKEFSAEDISEIVLDISSWNLKVLASSDEKVHIACSGDVKDDRDISVVQKDGKLMVQQEDDTDKNLAEQFSFGEAGKITLYIPENNAVSLDINNGSGEMELEAVSITALSLNNESGYVTMSDFMAETANIKSLSGDIKIVDASCTDSAINTESAYVTLKNTVIGKAAVSTDSGEVGISNVNNYDSLSVETGSGDISLSHERMPDHLSCHISSGSDDITVSLKNAEFSINTDGCKDGRIGKGKNSLSIMSNSGTVIVK